MPKLKTNKAAKKRYSLTATGKVKRTKSNRRHLLANKTKRQKKSGKIQNKLEIKEGEIDGKSKNSKNNKSKT